MESSSKGRHRASFTLWLGSYVALAWAFLVHVTDRILLFFKSPPRKWSARHSVMTFAALSALFTSGGTRETAHRNN
jgi:hypothetical protein